MKRLRRQISGGRSGRTVEARSSERQLARTLGRQAALLYAAVVFAVLSAPLICPLVQAHAQVAAASTTGVEGTWQGTLHVPNGPQFRTVIKIEKGGDGTLKSTFYSIDQDGAGLAASSTTFQDGELKISIQRINLTYTGKLSPDGKSINGEVAQGSPLPLILERATPATEWTIPEPPKPLPPMDPKADPSFEVATIKPSKPDSPGKLFVVQGDKFRTLNFTLGEMISAAYGVQSKQVIGAPDWVWTEKYDIEAQPDIPGIPSRTQLMREVQKLMADRFQLKFHRDKREIPALVLTVAKTGSKLKPSEGAPTGQPSLFFQGVGVLNVNNATLADFANLMQSAVLDRPMMDQTGLTGKYDFLLKWTPDESQLAKMGMPAPATEAADAPPNLFTALQEQLGLKLSSEKSQVDVMVIDKVEHPSAN